MGPGFSASSLSALQCVRNAPARLMLLSGLV